MNQSKPVGILPVHKIQDEDKLSFNIDSVEQSIIAYPVSEDAAQLPFQSFDIRSVIGAGSKPRVYGLLDTLVESL
jgi:hypothetical protein